MPLAVSAQSVDKQLHIAIAYDQQRYSGETVEKLGKHMAQLIELVSSASPNTRLDEILKVSEQDNRNTNWVDKLLDLELESVRDEIEKRASEQPNAIAVVFEDECLSYATLNNRANKLAQFLVKVGVQPEDPIALCFNRSLELIVTMLAVLKAGGAIVSVPPSLPSDRFTYILSDSASKLLLAPSEEVLPISTTDTDVPVLPLTKYWSFIATNMSAERPEVEVHPANIMYTIYTSGTTGKPKGVQIPHENLQTRLKWWISQLENDKTQRMLQSIPLGFDPSMYEIFGPLVMGACLDLYPLDKNTDVMRLREHIMNHRITKLTFTPALLNVTLDEGHFDNEVRLVWSGGEKLPEAVLTKFWDVFPKATLQDMYGPTETTIYVTTELYSQNNVPEFGEDLTIGRGINDGK